MAETLPPQGLGVAAGAPIRARDVRAMQDFSRRQDARVFGAFSTGTGSGNMHRFPPQRRVPSTRHAYMGYDASDGATPRVRIVPGTHNDFVPLIDEVPMNELIAEGAEPPNYPALTVAEGDKAVWVRLKIDDLTVIEEAEIFVSDEDVPEINLITHAQQRLFFIEISLVAGKAKVRCLQNVTGSQGWQYCNEGHRFWKI